jgi:hypothetical protein
LSIEAEAVRRTVGLEAARLKERVPQAPKCIPARDGQGQVRVFGRAVHRDTVHVNQQEIARGRAQQEHGRLASRVPNCTEQQCQRLESRAIN